MNVTDTNAYVNKIRIEATNLIVTLNKLRALRQKMDALALSTTIQDADIGGDNAGITNAQITSVLGTTLEAFEAVMAAGHATNLHTIAIM
jgi:hypothetical protein